MNDTESATDSSIVKPKKEKRIPKPKLPLEEGTKSIDTVFITNLPFDANIKTLNALFKEFKPKWIHVPTRRVPYKVLQKQKAQGKAPRNKGIAFVKFSDESLQKKAIEEFNGKEVNDRVIVVDVAIDARIPKDTDEEKVEEKAEEKAEEVAESE